MTTFRLGVAQLTSTDQLQSNLKIVSDLYSQADADLVVFPENTLFFRIRAGSELRGVKLDELSGLQKLVDKKGTPLMLTTAIADSGSRSRNSTLLFRPGNAIEEVYSKIHMFDVNVEGAPPVRESDNFIAGSKPRVVEINGWKFGLSICYDLRFAELYSHYAQKVDVILVPSAFLVPTGKAHWHVLLRARAIENQCYVAAPAQSGEHKSGDQSRHTFGHSLVVDPWGTVLSDQEGSPNISVVKLNKEQIAKVQKQIPMVGHRRL